MSHIIHAPVWCLFLPLLGAVAASFALGWRAGRSRMWNAAVRLLEAKDEAAGKDGYR